MDRGAKEDLVASLHRTFNETAVVIVSHYKGLTVSEMGNLRSQMREVGAQVKVTKNRLTRRALEGTPYRNLEALFQGPTAVAFADDPVATAKVAMAFAKSNDKLVILGAGVGNQVIDPEGVKALATLPSIDELRGKLLGMLSTPASRLVSVLPVPARQMATVIQAPPSKVIGVLRAYGEKDAA